MIRLLHSRAPRSLVLAVALSAFQLPLRTVPQTISVDVKVVNILASVRDRDGRIVANLTKDDFALEEDGRPQVIKYFSQEADLPLSLGLVVDTSISQRRVLKQERIASFSFLDEMVRPERDAAFIMHFDSDVRVLQEFTASRQRLQAGLGKLRQGDGRGAKWPERNCGFRGTLLYDALAFASDNLMRRRTGRKAVIVLSDGMDVGSCEPLENAIEFAQRADAIVYSIFFRDEEEYQRSLVEFERRSRGRRGASAHAEPPDGRKVLQRISGETGGHFFEVDAAHPLGQIFAAIQDELRQQYNLGYTSDRAGGPPGYRRIGLRTKQRSLRVQARDGYYAE